MRHYEHTVDALRAALLMYQRGYRYGVTFEVDISKLDAIAAKFDANFGTNLPGWKRYERRKKGLPNAWACSFPIGQRKAQVLLMMDSTPDDLRDFDATSPWARERWRPVESLEIAAYSIACDRRDRGDWAYTFRLSPRVLRGLQDYWRMLGSSHLEQLVFEAERAVASYALFGGVRRQLRRLIRGYAKLYQRKIGKPWPGPDPEQLPFVAGFRKGDA